MSVFSIANVLILMTVGVFQTLHAAVCPPGWLAWQQDACYILLPDKMNWRDAKNVCDRPGSSLVVPDSQEEHDFIWKEMKARMEKSGAQFNDLELWIGCKMFGIQGTFACNSVDGDPIYTNWGTNLHNIGQACVRMAERFDGQWGDTDCDVSGFAACKMRVSHRSYCLQADADGRFTPQCLLNHEIKNLTATGVVGCGRACWAEPRCRSFNLWQKGVDSNKVCQLNNAASIEADDADLNYVNSCSFFEL